MSQTNEIANPRFSIPPQYRDQLRYREAQDSRSDTEILTSLSQHKPITSEKNIWAFWHSGLDGLPSWCRRNLIAWHRLCGPSWTIRLLDSVPGSPNNALEWIDKDVLPEAFVTNAMEGSYAGPHSADLCRGAAVYLYGGVWMDVGVILLLDLDRLCWNQLADAATPYELCVPWVDGAGIANHFIAGRKGSIFLKKWHELFSYLWSEKGRTSSAGLMDQPLLKFRFAMGPGTAYERGYRFPFNVPVKEIFEYTAQIACWQRVAHLQEPGGFNGKEYYQNRVLKFDCLEECWYPEKEIGFIGQDLFDLLSVRTDADPSSEAYQQAERVVWKMLTSASMQKVTHGKKLFSTPALGTLWDMEENEGKDVEPGTFAELLRYGSVHFEQTRAGPEPVAGEPTELVLRKGLLEP